MFLFTPISSHCLPWVVIAIQHTSQNGGQPELRAHSHRGGKVRQSRRRRAGEHRGKGGTSPWILKSQSPSVNVPNTAVPPSQYKLIASNGTRRHPQKPERPETGTRPKQRAV